MDSSNNDRAIYLQIADGIMDEIIAGVYVPDGRIPSVREYAGRVEVNANTVMRAYDYLERNGTLYNRRGIGFFVSADAIERIKAAWREEFFSTDMPRVFSRMHSIGLTPAELSELYTQFIKTVK
ncbi:MAG: GntR family transcriptional regulator [Muribaculaceae bacterium]|nr:GntR family transcriptional regulator [Muribaculaceae bacterium]